MADKNIEDVTKNTKNIEKENNENIGNEKVSQENALEILHEALDDADSQEMDKDIAEEFLTEIDNAADQPQIEVNEVEQKNETAETNPKDVKKQKEEPTDDEKVAAAQQTMRNVISAPNVCPKGYYLDRNGICRISW